MINDLREILNQKRHEEAVPELRIRNMTVLKSAEVLGPTED
jgi:hypothetical protein